MKKLGGKNLEMEKSDQGSGGYSARYTPLNFTLIKIMKDRGGGLRDEPVTIGPKYIITLKYYWGRNLSKGFAAHPPWVKNVHDFFYHRSF